MRKTKSTRRTAALRKRYGEAIENGVDQSDDFEEVALDLSAASRPSLHRSLSTRSTSEANNPYNRDASFRPPFKSYVDTSPCTKSMEQLSLGKSVPGRNIALHAHKSSTSSLPMSAPEDDLSRRTFGRTSTLRRKHGDDGSSNSSNSSLESDSDDVPETVMFDNIPISPDRLPDHQRHQRNSHVQRESSHATGEPSSDDGKLADFQSDRLARRTSYHESLLGEMNADTRHLTAVLNDNAQQEVHRKEAQHPIQIGSMMSKSRSERRLSIKAIIKDMRPVLDRSIEAVPISKEKEALLTCTRPTHLPPKSRKEEKKHRKEYERLVFGSIEAEKKSQKRRSRALNQKAKHLTDSADLWDNHILPHFSTAIKDPRTKALWWGGLPNRVRGRIWSICIGNTLAVTEQTFEIALSNSRETLRKLQSVENDSQYESHLLTLDTFRHLEESVSNTFPDLRIFQKGGPLHEALTEVLMAYVYYRQDIMFSYAEGVNYIAGLLLMYQPPVQTFLTLVNVLNRSLPLAVYTRDEPVLNRFVGIFLTRLSERLPDLHKHIHLRLHLAPLVYLEPMLVSLLSKQAPVDISSRIFDIYAFEGDPFLIRAIVGVFIVLEHALYGTAQEVLNVLSGNDKEHIWEKNLKEEDFIKKCRAAF